MFKGAGMLDATRRSGVLDHETSGGLCADTVGLCGATINGLCAARPDCVAQPWGQIPDCHRKSGQCGAEPGPRSGLCAVSAGLCGAIERLCMV